MANYSVDIEVGLKGTERLRDLRTNIDALANKISTINSYADVFKAPLQNVNNYNKALKDAADALKKAEIGTKDEADAIKLYVQAMGDAEGAQQRRIRLIEDEIEAQKRLQTQRTISSKTIELGPGGPGFSGGFTPAERARANQVARERENAGRRETLELLNREVSFEIRLQNVRERNAALVEKQARRGAAVSNAVIGGAFPLLFGQGIGASLGGAIGGGIGGMRGGQAGFGGSLVGTFAGQATVDFAINSALQLGKALQKPTENIQELTKFLGIAGTQLDANISTLQKLGMESSASAAGLAKLEEILKAEGYKNLTSLSDDLVELENAFSRLKLAAANILAEPLTKVLDWLTDTLKLFSKAGGIGGFITTSPTELQALDKQVKQERLASQAAATDPNSPAALQAQKLVTAERERQLNLTRAQLQLEYDRTGLTRTALAARQGEIEIMTITNQLEKVNIELQKEKSKAKRDQLSFDKSQLELQKQLAEAAKRTAIIEAQRQVEKERLGLYVQQGGVISQINTALNEREKLTKGELIGIQKQRESLDSELSIRNQILVDQKTAALIGVNELDIRKEISDLYDGLSAQLAIEIKNRRMALDQQEAQYNLTQLQIQQQRDLANLQTKTQMGLELKNLQGGIDPRFFGVFGGSRQMQELMGTEMQARLGLMQTELAGLQSQAAIPNLNPDELQRLQQQSQALEDQIGLYERYQPAIINASVAQQRFNEALSLTAPVVDNVFNSITAVAEGTKTAQQAFADFLMSIANMLMETVKQMIVQYIALGIARQFAGVPAAGGGESNAAFMQRTGGLDLAGSLYKRANGGPVSAGTPYLVGERGPELFMPRTSGSIYPNDAMGVGGSNIVVNVDATGSSVQGNADDSKRLGQVIGAAVQQELIKQKRPGGLLA